MSYQQARKELKGQGQMKNPPELPSLDNHSPPTSNFHEQCWKLCPSQQTQLCCYAPTQGADRCDGGDGYSGNNLESSNDEESPEEKS